MSRKRNRMHQGNRQRKGWAAPPTADMQWPEAAHPLPAPPIPALSRRWLIASAAVAIAVLAAGALWYA